MDRQYTVYLLIGLLVLLGGLVAMYFVFDSRTKARERQRRSDSQAERERKAERRMADNGGVALSAGSATRADPSTVPGHSPQNPAPRYPEGGRRPGESAGSKGRS